MKDAKNIIVLLIVVVLASIACGYAAGFIVYKDYKQKAAYFDEQAQQSLDKFSKLEGNLKDIYITLESTIDENKIDRKGLLSAMEEVKKDIKSWERGYGIALTELKESMENLKVERLTRIVENMQDDISGFKMKIQDLELKLDESAGRARVHVQDGKDIDLGRISVKK